MKPVDLSLQKNDPKSQKNLTLIEKLKQSNTPQTIGEKVKRLSPLSIFTASFSATICRRTSLNIFDVASTQIFKDILREDPGPTNSASQVDSAASGGSKTSATASMSKKLVLEEKLPSRNIFKVIPYLIQKNGPKVIFAGYLHAIGANVSRTFVYFPIFETRNFTKKIH